MKAAVLKKFNEPLDVEEVKQPEPRSGELLIHVEASGVCHSDLHIADGENDYIKAFVKLPLIPGHEIVGRVAAIGPNVTGFKTGDRVGVPWINSSCDACEYCLSGRETLCARQIITGAMVDGGYAEYAIGKATHATRVPAELSPEQAAPFFCAGVTVYRGIRKAGVRLGDRVGVFGIGGLGHLAVQLAKQAGAKVFAIDISDEKSQFALECGADEAINAARTDPSSILQRKGGLHVALVTSASPAAYQSAFFSLARGGTLAMLGIPAESVPFAPLPMIAMEAKVIASAVGSRQEIREVLQLAADGKLKCRTTARKLEDINSVFDELKRGEILGRAVLAFD